MIMLTWFYLKTLVSKLKSQNFKPNHETLVPPVLNSSPNDQDEQTATPSSSTLLAVPGPLVPSASGDDAKEYQSVLIANEDRYNHTHPHQPSTASSSASSTLGPDSNFLNTPGQEQESSPSSPTLAQGAKTGEAAKAPSYYELVFGTPHVLNLMMSNLGMCLANELTLAVLPLWAFTPVKFGKYKYSASQCHPFIPSTSNLSNLSQQ